MQGKILKAIAGFHYVQVAGSGIYECKARGIFRKENRKPLVGDDVLIETISEEEKTGNVIDILPRRSELKRPPVANVDQALILFAMRTPDPNLMLLDRFLILSERAGIDAVICFNKLDAAAPGQADDIRAIYESAGVPVHFISVRTGEGMEQVRALLKGKTTVLAGPSGAGKSSLTNAILGGSYMEVGDISRKLARGKNTTRHSELICVEEGTFLCDTPGFTALDPEAIGKEELDRYFEEFSPFIGRCYFQGCAHMAEPGCAVKDAVADGKIHPVRYDHYCYLYEELKDEERRRYR